MGRAKAVRHGKTEQHKIKRLSFTPEAAKDFTRPLRHARKLIAVAEQANYHAYGQALKADDEKHLL
jgi:hypothetical protein